MAGTPWLLQCLMTVKRLMYGMSGTSEKKKVSIPHLILGMVLYGVLPIDALPDFIPLIGHADDGMVILVLSAIIIRILLRGRQQRKQLTADKQ